MFFRHCAFREDDGDKKDLPKAALAATLLADKLLADSPEFPLWPLAYPMLPSFPGLHSLCLLSFAGARVSSEHRPRGTPPAWTAQLGKTIP